MENKKIALVYSFPGILSAEKELCTRFKVAAKNIGYEIVVIDNSGFILDDDMNKTSQQLPDEDSLFVINMHFFDLKLRDNFYYYTVWNPPEIPLSIGDNISNINNVISNDDYLIYDNGSMSDHLKTMLIDDKRNIKDSSCLLGSFPKSVMLEPNLDTPKLFYCGMNWEVCSGKGRHNGLFHLLDNSNLINIYGPKHPKGWKYGPWDGYKNYKGEIPFDGLSILNVINKHGIVLAVSSDYHRRAGAVTNRIYEACAAGAIVISDDNEFVINNFGDSVLYINFDKNNPLNTYKQIEEKIKWVNSNRDKAKNMIKKAQKLFVEKFCMEEQLKKVIDNHKNRIVSVENSICSLQKDERILIIYNLDTIDFNTKKRKELNFIIAEFDKQIYQNKILVIICDTRIKSFVAPFIENRSNIQIFSFDIFNKANLKILTRAQTLRRVLNSVKHDYFSVLEGNEHLFRNHYSILKRKLEDNKNAIFAYSGLYNIDDKGNRSPIISNVQAYKSFYNCNPRVCGIYLFSKNIEDIVPTSVDSNLDGLEIFAYINRALFTNRGVAIYSQHITCGISANNNYKSPILTEKMQLNLIQGLVNHKMLEMKAPYDIDLFNFENKEYRKYLNKILLKFISIDIILYKIKKIIALSKTRKNNISNKLTNLKQLKKYIRNNQ